MAVNWSFFRPSGPPLLALLHDIRDVPNSLKCLSCAKVFRHKQERARHYIKKPGRPVCPRVTLAVGNGCQAKNQQLSKLPLPPSAPRKTLVYQPYPRVPLPAEPRCRPMHHFVPSHCIRIPWGPQPAYESRRTLRAYAQQRQLYTVCIETHAVDPLVLWEYLTKVGVFAAKDGLPKDTDPHVTYLFTNVSGVKVILSSFFFGS